MRTDDLLHSALESLRFEEHGHAHVCLECGTLEVAFCDACGSYSHNEDVLLGRGLLDDVAAVARERDLPVEEAFRLLLLGGLLITGRGDAVAASEVANLLVGERRAGLRLVTSEGRSPAEDPNQRPSDG